MTPHTSGPEPDLLLLRELRAARAVPDSHARDAARAELLARAEAAAVGRDAGSAPRAATAGRGWRRPRIHLGPRHALIAALLAVALVVGGLTTRSDPPAGEVLGAGGSFVVHVGSPPAASAAEALGDVADQTQRQAAVPFGPGTLWITRTEESELIVHPEGYAMAQPSVVTLTTGYDGLVHMHSESLGTPEFTAQASRAAWKAAGSPHTKRGKGYDGPLLFSSGTPGQQPRGVFQFGDDLLTPAELLALPTDTAALASRVAAAGRQRSAGLGTTAAQWFNLGTITDLMVRAPLSPAVRAALWRVVGTYPAVRLEGPHRDPKGRLGVGILIASGGQRQEIVYNPRTGMLLSDWIYQDSPITTCDRDLAPCDESQTPTDPQGRPWKVLAAPGSVVYGKTFLSAKVVSAE